MLVSAQSYGRLRLPGLHIYMFLSPVLRTVSSFHRVVFGKESGNKHTGKNVCFF